MGGCRAMQREKPAFEVIPNWPRKFPARLERLQEQRLAVNQKRSTALHPLPVATATSATAIPATAAVSAVPAAAIPAGVSAAAAVAVMSRLRGLRPAEPARKAPV